MSSESPFQPAPHRGKAEHPESRMTSCEWDTMACKRILLVEDEAITGMDIREMVMGLGYEPHGPVASGKDAVAAALVLRPDLILMDIMLKGPMTGLQAAAAIQSHYRCPVIYLTGSSDQAGADLPNLTEPAGLVLKPIDEEELRMAIEKALNRCEHEEP